MNTWIRPFTLFVFVALVFSSAVAVAATIEVDEVIDDDPVVNNGFCSLREAVIAANTNTAVDTCSGGDVGADTINLPAGTYHLSIAGTGEDGAISGDLDILEALTIAGAGPGVTVIDGKKIDRIIDNHAASDQAVSINGISMQNGEADLGGAIFNRGKLTVNTGVVRNSSSLGDGGGVFNSGDFTLVDGSLYANSAVSNGGGIYNTGNGTLTVNHSMIGAVLTPNVADFGGGIYNWDGSVMLTDSHVLENNATDGEGGGIYNRAAATLVLNSCGINGNEAVSIASSAGGGGIANYGALNISNCEITGNKSDFGGGILNNTGTLTLTGSLVQGNTALSGGGINNSGYGTAQISQSSILGNSAVIGAGISTAGDLTLIASTVNGNTASNHTGGIQNNHGTLFIKDSTISGNSGNTGVGGINQAYDAVIVNSTISGNTGTGLRAYCPVGRSTQIRNTTISDNTNGVHACATVRMQNSAIVANTDADCTSGVPDSQGYNADSDGSCALAAEGDLSAVDALLGPLADNGGPTQTHASFSASPLIDGANPAGCTWDDDFDSQTPEVVLNADQRGSDRPQDGDGDGDAVCDIGAYEHIPTADIMVTDAVAPQDDLVVTFAQVQVGGEDRQMLKIANIGSADLQLTDVRLDGADANQFRIDPGAGATPCGTLAIVISGGQHCTLAVTFAPQGEGAKTAGLQITSDDPDEGTVQVELFGSALRPQPDITVSESSPPFEDLQIDYGELVAGGEASVTHIVTLANDGQVALTLKKFTLSGTDSGDFLVDFAFGDKPCGGAEIIIESGKNCTVGVRFAPLSAGKKSAALEIHSDDADEGVVRLTLTGSGTAPGGTGSNKRKGGGAMDPAAIWCLLMILLANALRRMRCYPR